MINNIAELVNQYGVTIVVAVGMAYFIFYIWKFVTSKILPSLGQASTTLIALIDRIRMLDNDMIRLDQKIHTIIEIQDQRSDTFESAMQKRKDAQQDNKIDTNSQKIKELREKKE